jgi:transposase InsO family protein/DNA-binding transcriptional regulator YiaG
MKRRSLDTLALRALVKSTHLLGLALAERLREYRDSGDPLLDRFAQLKEEALHAALLGETADILAVRWDKLPERQRPHYSPLARFRILRIRALLALSADETARMFRVSSGTVLRWERELQAAPDQPTVGSLVKPTPPVRRFADVVRHVVQTLTLAGFPGDASVAAFLARAGWGLSRRTAQRIRKEKPITPEPPQAETGSRVVRARYPNHVWMMDITEIPGFLRLFSFKLAVVFDVFSRVPLAARVFLSEPNAAEVARLFASSALRFGAPRHSVSDQGPQFTSETFRNTLAYHGVRHRYGAVGQTGSIALIERFFLTLKTVLSLGSRPPLLRPDLERRLALFFAYYTCLRPHQGLGGGTPAERFLGLRPAHLDAIPPPRGRPGERVQATPPFVLRFLDPEGRLPHLARRAA